MSNDPRSATEAAYRRRLRDNPALQDRWLLIILASALVLRVALALLVQPLQPRADEIDYIRYARALAESGSYPDLYRPPMYPAVLAVVLALHGKTAAILVLQGLLGTASVAFLYHMTRVSFGALHARTAAAIVALDPLLIAFTHFLWTETLFIFFMLGGLSLLVTEGKQLARKRLLLSGAVLGLAALTRPVILTFVPFILLWMVVHHLELSGQTASGNRWRRPAAAWLFLVCACAAVVLPWTIRNYRATGDFVLVDVNSAFNVLLGTSHDAAFVDKDDHWSWEWTTVDGVAYREAVRSDPGATQRRAIELALQRILADPGWYARKSIWEAGHLWTLDSFVFRHLRNGWYGEGVPHWVMVGAVPLLAGFTLILFLSGFVGLSLMESGRLRTLVALAVIHAVLVFGLTFSLSRYSVPLRPLLAIPAAWVLVNAPGLKTQLTRKRGRWLLVIAVVAILAWVWARDIPLLWDMLTADGAHHRFRNL